MVCHCILIEGAEGLVLIDTGFGASTTRAIHGSSASPSCGLPPAGTRREDAISQVRELGLQPGDVRPHHLDAPRAWTARRTA